MMNYLKTHIIGLAGIVLLTAFIFSPSLQFSFVNWDDFYYVTDNLLIRDLSWPSIIKIFTSDMMGNYQPLVVLSLALDFHCYGLNPGGYHFTNILFHLANVVLVCAFLQLLGIKRGMSLFVTLLFALHPLRVESVVWVTERKDVLFLCTYLLSTNFYLISKRFDGLWNPYLIGSLFFFLLALLSKPSTVSLPFILILLDWITDQKISWKSVVDKFIFLIPAFSLAMFTSYGYHAPFEYDYLKNYIFSSTDHFFMGFASLLMYCQKLIWPHELIGYYPYPQKINGFLPPWYYASPLIFAGMMGILYRLVKDRKLFYFSCCFFGITILLNLAFFNFGNVIIADRYTYLPSIGFFLILVQLIQELYERIKIKFFQLVLISVIVTAVFLMSLKTFSQVFVWQNSETLWSQVLHYYPRETMALYNRGNHFASMYEYEKALKDYSTVISIDPKDSAAFNNRGNMYLLLGRNNEAFHDYNQSIKIDPRSPKAYLNRAEYFRVTSNIKAALKDLDTVLTINPQHQQALQMKKRLIEKINSSP